MYFHGQGLPPPLSVENAISEANTQFHWNAQLSMFKQHCKTTEGSWFVLFFKPKSIASLFGFPMLPEVQMQTDYNPQNTRTLHFHLPSQSIFIWNMSPGVQDMNYSSLQSILILTIVTLLMPIC